LEKFPFPIQVNKRINVAECTSGESFLICYSQHLNRNFRLCSRDRILCSDKDCDCNGGNCPGGKSNKPGNKPGNTNQPSSPMQDSNVATNSGPGQVDGKKIKDLADKWGTLPPRDRESAMRELTRDMPERYREVIKEYFRRLSQQADADATK
jgi:hypothetical protein